MSMDVRPNFDSTSAAGAMLVRQAHEPVLVGFMLAGLGTSSAPTLSAEQVQTATRFVLQTTSGVPVATTGYAGAAISELRRLSGFTWDQLARLFKVSRRSLHFWASGKVMAPSNEEHLQRLLVAVRAVDRGSARANRTALLTGGADGAIPFDLLAAEQYEQAVALVGPSDARRLSAPKLAAEAREARAPRRPEELVDALQDRVHASSGRLLASKAVRVPRRK